MQYTAKTLDAFKQRSHCLVVTCYEGAKLSDTAAAVNAAGRLAELPKYRVTKKDNF